VADPTIDETRDGARVVVYGDESPVTEQEWYCARLTVVICGGAPLKIAPLGTGWACTAHGGGSIYMSAVATRVGAVCDVVEMLVDFARRYTTGRMRNSKRAARLRAILAGAP
jgi:hypothetical protein